LLKVAEFIENKNRQKPGEKSMGQKSLAISAPIDLLVIRAGFTRRRLVLRMGQYFVEARRCLDREQLC
jgi:hypothetical protein